MRAAYLKLDLLGGPGRRETMKLFRFSGEGHLFDLKIID